MQRIPAARTGHRKARCSVAAAVTPWPPLPRPPVWPAREWGPAPMPGPAGSPGRSVLPGGRRTPGSCLTPYGPALSRPCPPGERGMGLFLDWRGLRYVHTGESRHDGGFQGHLRKPWSTGGGANSGGSRGWTCGGWLPDGCACWGGKAVATDFETRGAVHRPILAWPEGDCCGRAALSADGLVPCTGGRTWANREGL